MLKLQQEHDTGPGFARVKIFKKVSSFLSAESFKEVTS